MRPIPWTVLGVVFALTTVLLFVDLRAGLDSAALLTAAIAALATCVGALCATASYAQGTSDAEHRRRKERQLVLAGVAAVLAAWFFVDTPGVAAIIGIAVAMGVGAVWPRQDAVHAGSGE